jgi:hypothetical protein
MNCTIYPSNVFFVMSILYYAMTPSYHIWLFEVDHFFGSRFSIQFEVSNWFLCLRIRQIGSISHYMFYCILLIFFHIPSHFYSVGREIFQCGNDQQTLLCMFLIYNILDLIVFNFLLVDTTCVKLWWWDAEGFTWTFIFLLHTLDVEDFYQ